MYNISAIKSEAKKAIKEFLEKVDLRAGQVVVVGCSTSEVAGQRIGSAGSLEIAKAIFYEIITPLQEKGIYLAIQCCEHLNRALVIEREAAEKYCWEEVYVVPHGNAGGSLAAEAYRRMVQPVLVEEISAHAGLDIGDTFIGMHLKKIAVPLRLETKQIGKAHLTVAKTRPKLIGGERAKYCI